VTRLGTLGGRAATAGAINDRSEVIGAGYTATGSWRAVVWRRARLTPLATLGGAGSQVTAPRAINDRGEIVGQSATARGSRHAVLWVPE
jgi:probable HAF family extracellular repeat protein